MLQEDAQDFFLCTEKTTFSYCGNVWHFCNIFKADHLLKIMCSYSRKYTSKQFK